MQKLVKIGKDFYGLVRVCGPLLALRWILCVHFHLSAILKSGNLQPADKAMGIGPFQVNLKQYKCRFKITGPQSLTGIREMYVRDVYLRNGWLKIKPDDIVLDLGANMGNFTNLALAVDPTIRVIAVEPNTYSNSLFTTSVDLNDGHLARTTLIRAILGKPAEKLEGDEHYEGAECITEEQLLERADISRIDFLKCDIEGGEFGLLTQKSRLLAMTKALACEVHAFAGDVNRFLADIEACGFTIGPTQYSLDGGSVTFLAKRNA
jgi:FkbM family methyltransferase